MHFSSLNPTLVVSDSGGIRRFVVRQDAYIGRGPDMTLVHPPHILANLYFFELLGCPEYEIGL